SALEAIEFEESYGLHIIHASEEIDFARDIADLVRAVEDIPAPETSRRHARGQALDLIRSLRHLPRRADLALDAALSLDLVELQEMMQTAEAAGGELGGDV